MKNSWVTGLQPQARPGELWAVQSEQVAHSERLWCKAHNCRGSELQVSLALFEHASPPASLARDLGHLESCTDRFSDVPLIIWASCTHAQYPLAAAGNSNLPVLILTFRAKSGLKGTQTPYLPYLACLACLACLAFNKPMGSSKGRTPGSKAQSRPVLECGSAQLTNK